MRLVISFLALSLSLSSMAISVGDKVLVLRDTKLMSGATVLAPIKKDTQLEVKAIDPRSRQWLQTEIIVAEKAIKGWVSIRDVKSMTGECATGFAWKCESVPTSECNTTCENECSMQNNWVCENNSEFDPETGTWNNTQSCWWENQEVCAPKCTQECWTEFIESCGCKKSADDNSSASWLAPN